MADDRHGVMRWHLETFRQENTFVLVGENCAYVSNSYHVYKTNWCVFDIQKVFFIKYCKLLSINDAGSQHWSKAKPNVCSEYLIAHIDCLDGLFRFFQNYINKEVCRIWWNYDFRIHIFALSVCRYVHIFSFAMFNFSKHNKAQLTIRSYALHRELHCIHHKRRQNRTCTFYASHSMMIIKLIWHCFDDVYATFFKKHKIYL